MGKIKYRRVPLKNFKGYSIDTEGNVYSDDRTVYRNGKPYVVKGKKLSKVSTQPLKYNRVWLYVDGKMFQPYVMTLMGQAFLGSDKSDKKELNHINCDRTDDRLANLELMNRSENVKHSYDVCRKR